MRTDLRLNVSSCRLPHLIWEKSCRLYRFRRSILRNVPSVGPDLLHKYPPTLAPCSTCFPPPVKICLLLVFLGLYCVKARRAKRLEARLLLLCLWFFVYLPIEPILFYCLLHGRDSMLWCTAVSVALSSVFSPLSRFPAALAGYVSSTLCFS